MNGITSYNWNTPGTWTVTHQNPSGPNDTAIIVQFPNGFTSGSMSVTASNGCGTSVTARNLAIGKLNPATPSPIDVIQLAFCPGNRIYSYTLSGMPANATSIAWTVPPAAIGGYTVLSPISISVEYPPTAVAGNVTAQALNNCANSVVRVSLVKLPACPPEFAGKTNAVSLPVKDEAMNVQVSPNPTELDFSVKVITAGKEKIQVRILDLQGRMLKQQILQPFETRRVGADLKAGTYLLEVRQGNKIQTTRILKL
jgi:hypothetical protein